MKSLFFFNSMITPKIITAIYWLLLLGCIVGGIGYMFAGYGGITASKFFSGLGILIGGSIGVRLWCELMIVLFKINSNLQVVADKP